MQPLKSFTINNPIPGTYDGPARYDLYNLLHVCTDCNLVTHFVTGEMCIGESRGAWDRAYNRHFKQRHVVIASTGDTDFGTQLTGLGITLHDPDTDEELKPAWLNTDPNGGSCTQRLLIDLDHNMAVLLRASNRSPDSVPRHIQMCGGVYYPSARAAPEGGTVQITRPHAKTDEEKEHIKQLTAASSAWWEMSGWAERTGGYLKTGHFHELSGGNERHQWSSFYTVDRQALTYAEIENKTFEDLSGMDRYRLVHHPVKFPRDKKIVDSLRVRHRIPKP